MSKGLTAPKALILVGGQGTRLLPLTYYVPKPMVSVLNRPFLDHTIAYLKQYGITHIIMALSHLSEVIQGYLGDGGNRGVRLNYTVETNPLGTAGAVKNAEQYLDDTFVVLNGDIFSGINIADIMAYHRQKNAKATIAVTWVDNPSAFGVVETDSEWRIQRFMEKPAPGTATTNWINAGIYVLEPEVMRLVPPDSHYMFEKGLFPLLLSLNEPMYAYQFKGYWLDMGTVGKYLRLNRDLLNGTTGSPLIQGLDGNGIFCEDEVIIDASATISGPAIIGAGCKISERATVKGPVVLGKNCRVGAGAMVQDSVIWDDVEIGANARIEQSVICRNCRIGRNGKVLKQVITPDYGAQDLKEA